MAFLSRQRPIRARPGSGLGRNAKKTARAALGVYAAAAGKAKWKSRLTYTFPLLNHSLGTGTTIWIYGLICALGFALVWNRLPETRGKTLEEIETDWK
jgi:hypothetical protein